jgi:glyoxylase-like metal-dependent hydrolase (beta-lactamase superfamily II)
MIIPIEKNVYLVQGQKPSRFPYCNCLLIDDEVRTVIDTGLEREDIPELKPGQIELIINSHGHGDHINGNQAFPQAKVAVHHLEADSLQSPEAFGDSLGLHKWAELMPVPLNFNVDFDHPGKHLTIKDSRVVRFPESRVDSTFGEGDKFQLGKVTLTVLHTPGHSAGHSCFYWEAAGILFSTDIDLAYSGPWYGSKSANLDDFIASIKRIRELKPRTLIPGHGRLITENQEQRFANYLNCLYEREEALLKLLREPQTLEELAKHHIIYADHANPLFQYWEKIMVLKHLERLERCGQIKQQEGHYFR